MKYLEFFSKETSLPWQGFNLKNSILAAVQRGFSLELHQPGAIPGADESWGQGQAAEERNPGKIMGMWFRLEKSSPDCRCD